MLFYFTPMTKLHDPSVSVQLHTRIQYDSSKVEDDLSGQSAGSIFGGSPPPPAPPSIRSSPNVVLPQALTHQMNSNTSLNLLERTIFSPYK